MIIPKEALTSINTKVMNALSTEVLGLSIGALGLAVISLAAIGFAGYTCFPTAEPDHEICIHDGIGGNGAARFIAYALVLLLLGSAEYVFGLREKVTGAISAKNTKSVGELIKEEFEDIGRDARIVHTALSAFFFLNVLALLFLAQFGLIEFLPALNSIFTAMFIAVYFPKAIQHFF